MQFNSWSAYSIDGFVVGCFVHWRYVLLFHFCLNLLNLDWAFMESKPRFSAVWFHLAFESPGSVYLLWILFFMMGWLSLLPPREFVVLSSSSVLVRFPWPVFYYVRCYISFFLNAPSVFLVTTDWDFWHVSVQILLSWYNLGLLV